MTILENEISRITRAEYGKSASLAPLSEQLFGYPLAGQLAAPLVEKYGPDYLLRHMYHIKELRVDIAEAILAHTDIGSEAVQTLEILAVCTIPLSVDALSKISRYTPEEVVRIIDALADHNLVRTEGIEVTLHPLIADFYWKRARSGPDFASTVQAIAAYAIETLKCSGAGTQEYVAWLGTACRMLFLKGDVEGARRLRSDLTGELRFAAIELYQRGEYRLALRYCDEYLVEHPQDFEILFHRARCLSRLERHDEASALIDTLFQHAATPQRKARLHFAKGRTWLEARKLEDAKASFMKALDLQPDLVPALQGVGEVLLRMNALDDAAGFLERALRVSPMDAYVLSSYSDVLWRRGRYEDAIHTMEPVIRAQPQNASFLFRIGRFFQQTGEWEKAYSHFQRAKQSDQSYLDVRLSLASVAIDLGKLDEAKQQIDAVRDKATGEKHLILQNIEAQYELARGNIERAIRLASDALKQRRTVPSLGLMAKIEAQLCREALAQGQAVLADSHREQALKLLGEGLVLEPTNPQLLKQMETMESIPTP